MNEQPLVNAHQPKILSLDAETPFVPNGIVSRTVLTTTNSRVVLFGFSAGQQLTEHTSTRHAVIQILSGECEFSLAGQPHRVKAGDLVYLPPNLPHAVKATQQFSMLLTLTKPETSSAERAEVPPEKVCEVDARGLEPPQPLVKILESLDALPTNTILRARTDRRPILLYPQLEKRGFNAETEEQPDGSYVTRIRAR